MNWAFKKGGFAMKKFLKNGFKASEDKSPNNYRLATMAILCVTMILFIIEGMPPTGRIVIRPTNIINSAGHGCCCKNVKRIKKAGEAQSPAQSKSFIKLMSSKINFLTGLRLGLQFIINYII